MRISLIFLVVPTVLVGCASSPLATIPARQIETQRISVGAAQQLKVGMSGADVISVLGSPNIITGDSSGGETWVYEKSAREYEMVSGQEGFWFFSRRDVSISVASSRTLIVVVTLNTERKLQRVAYRQTNF